jgi:methionyl-tRNA formyltransferase
MKVVFAGTPQLAALILDKLVQDKIEVISVITQPDKPVGRKQILTFPPVKEMAIKHNLPCTQVKNKEELNAHLENLEFDFLVVIAFGMLIKKESLKLAKKENINIHYSLLPKYRGASPIHSALLNDDKKTGISFMRIEEEMDSGALFKQITLDIQDSDDIEILTNKLNQLAVENITEVLKDIESGALKAKFQEGKISHCSKFKKTDAITDPKSMTAREIFKKFQAFKLWPKVKVEYANDLITLNELKLTEKKASNKKEILIKEDSKLYLNCQDKLLEIIKIQPSGKPSISAIDFINGYLKD